LIFYSHRSENKKTKIFCLNYTEKHQNPRIKEKKMKKEKISLILALLAIFCILASIPVYAAPKWYNCTVDRVGPNAANSNSYIMLTDTDGLFTKKWCIASSAYVNQFLAVALTALSNGNPVIALIDASLSYPTIHALYLGE
jgi:hypothetical protein